MMAYVSSPSPGVGGGGSGLRKEDCCKFKINLDYIAVPYVKNQHTHTTVRGDKK